MSRINVAGYAWALRTAMRAAKPPPPSNALLMFRLRRLLPIAEAAINAGCFDLVEERLLKALADIPARHRSKVYRTVVPECVRSALRG